MSSQALLCIPDARLRSLFSLLLTDGDAQVTACHDGDELQRVLVTRFYDLCAITLDASPDLAGFIKTVRYLSPDTRILLIANKDDVEQIIPLFPLGISEVLLQPINPKKAITAIHKLLEAKVAEMPAEMEAGGGAESLHGQSGGSSHRPQHITARSPAMRALVNQLWQARQESMGLILKGEPGTEFELIAREYQAICGDPNGYLYVLGHHEITSDGLATAASLDRLNDGIPRTFFIKDLEKLAPPQQSQLLDFLRLAKRRRDKDRPLRFVFTVAECDEKGRNLELPFIEELLFVIPLVVKVPALRDRKADIEPMARKILLELTAIYPEYRVRSLKAAVIEWLSCRLWRGNFEEFCAYLRQVIMECPSRELTMAYLTTREAAFAGRASSNGIPPPLTTTTSMDTTVASEAVSSGKTLPVSSPAKGSLPPMPDKSGRLTAKQLLATIR
jgi:DNA-binding NtrC family response regulator